MNDKDKLDRYQCLIISAASCCTDIFEDFDSSEIESQPPSIRHAWQVGRKIDEMEDD